MHKTISLQRKGHTSGSPRAQVRVTANKGKKESRGVEAEHKVHVVIALAQAALTEKPGTAVKAVNADTTSQPVGCGAAGAASGCAAGTAVARRMGKACESGNGATAGGRTSAAAGGGTAPACRVASVAVLTPR